MRAPTLAALAIAAVGCGDLPAPPHPDVGVPTQRNSDGFNYGIDASRTSDFLYNQLWYFNFIDPEQDLAGVAAYGLANPENRMFQQGLTVSFGMVIRDASKGASFAAYSEQWDPSLPGKFAASATFEPGPGPELENPGGTIEVISPDHYHVVGRSLQGERAIYWDLHYRRRLADPWLPWVRWPVPRSLGIVPAWVDYHMQMADAVVDGTFRVVDGDQDVTYVLDDARGYHDGFYSKFVFSSFEWDWLDYKQDDLAIQLLHPHAPTYSCADGWVTCTPGNLRVVVADGAGMSEFNFYRGRGPSEAQIQIGYDAWATDSEWPQVRYPIRETIRAQDAAGNRLELRWQHVRHLVVYYDVPDPFDDTVTFEIIADFEGSFRDATRGIEIPISGRGWTDWSGPAFPETGAPDVVASD